MFTGIVETVGTVSAVRSIGGGRRLTIDAAEIAPGTIVGASIAVDGACLTVCEADGDRLHFDVVAETLDRSNLGALQTGHRVNLERSLRVGDRLDGHFVQGHVDGTSEITHKQSGERGWKFTFTVDDVLRPYIVPKGSVTVDGISLTIAGVSNDGFSVALIPTTIARTTLWDKQVGDMVNIETDVLVRTIVHWLKADRASEGGQPLTLAKLQEHGFA